MRCSVCNSVRVGPRTMISGTMNPAAEKENIISWNLGRRGGQMYTSSFNSIPRTGHHHIPHISNPTPWRLTLEYQPRRPLLAAAQRC